MVRSVRARRSGPFLASLRKGPPRRVLLRGRALRRPPLRPNPVRFARWPGLRGGAPPGQLSCVTLERYERGGSSSRVPTSLRSWAGPPRRRAYRLARSWSAWTLRVSCMPGGGPTHQAVARSWRSTVTQPRWVR